MSRPLGQMREAVRMRHYSIRTQESIPPPGARVPSFFCGERQPSGMDAGKSLLMAPLISQ